MSPWVDIPAGTVRLGLSDRDARVFAEWAAERAHAEADDEGMDLKGRVALEERWGNPEHLIELLAFARPEHVVDLPEFSISARPVSVAEYAEFVRETGARAPESWPHGSAPRPDEPVTGISWEEAAAYAAWRGAALPTEAQWERAARGPDGTLVVDGDDEGTAGVEGMIGDRYEWTADEFKPYPGADRRACERVPPPPGGWWGTRTRRGGALPGFPAAAFLRGGADPTLRLRDTTFRLVKRR
jgi:formylglycine-generating enzyme required for sulfatase activity